MSQKQLEDVLIIDHDHLIINCCPRFGNTSNPTGHGSVEHAFGDSHLMKGARAEYTFYYSLGGCYGLAEATGVLEVTCPHCKTQYELTKSFLKEEFLKFIKKRDEMFDST
jgi:phage FluMu protein Com